MSGAVFDAAAIAKRRQELFPPMRSEPDRGYIKPAFDRDRFGTPIDHCQLCPRTPGENCELNCTRVREEMDDGVTVTEEP